MREALSPLSIVRGATAGLRGYGLGPAAPAGYVFRTRSGWLLDARSARRPGASRPSSSPTGCAMSTPFATSTRWRFHGRDCRRCAFLKQPSLLGHSVSPVSPVSRDRFAAPLRDPDSQFYLHAP